MKKYDLSTNESFKPILDKCDDFHFRITSLQNELDNILESRIDWMRENSKLIKSFLPKVGYIYQVTEIPKDWEYRNLQDSIYYFKVLNLRFDPKNTFKYNWKDIKYPIVKGELYDVNFNHIPVYNDEIEITRLKEIDISANHRDSLTYVYIMIDKNTGFYKIGRSKNPKVRESTLQSEKPTIEMIFNHIAKVSDEKVLHDTFSEKRVRGEWFDLSGSDIEKIKEYFKAA